MNGEANKSTYCFTGIKPAPYHDSWSYATMTSGLMLPRPVVPCYHDPWYCTGSDTITHLYYMAGGIYVRQTRDSAVLKDEMYYVHADHLGSFAIITDSKGDVKQQCTFDAWGRRTFVVRDSSLVFDRGFTGHEHLDEFGLINMNGRMYEPLLGRFLSPDPYVPDMAYSQDFNRYSYARNNPLIYTDPTGEFLWLIAAALTYALFSTDVGYDIQKFIFPGAVKFEVHPFASNEQFFGIKSSVGLPQSSPVAYRWEWGANYYTKFYDTGWEGWETTYGEEYGLLGGYSASFTEYTMHGMDDFNQTVLRLTWGGPGLSARYSNDYIHKDQFKFFRKLTLDHVITKGDDMQDRWNTSSVHIQLGPMSLGTKIITGDPGPDNERNIKRDENGQQYYALNGEYDPLKYSEGIFYVGFGPFRIGRNSERIRNYFQNEIGHRPRNIPFFPMIPDKNPRWYWFW